MIYLSGIFYFDCEQNNPEGTLVILNRMKEQSQRQSMTFDFNINGIEQKLVSTNKNDYLVKAEINVGIDETYYSVNYDEVEVQQFVERYLEYSLDFLDLHFLYMENIELSANKVKNRNSVYDNYCITNDKKEKPIITTKKEKEVEVDGRKILEKNGRKRKIFIVE